MDFLFSGPRLLGQVRTVAPCSLRALVGWALLDRNDPQRLIGRTRLLMLSPKEPYEKAGDAPNAVFSRGRTLLGEEVWRCYGAADSNQFLATTRLNYILEVIDS